MKLNLNKQKRVFAVGKKQDILIEDLGGIKLNNNELLSLTCPGDARHEIVAKNWGFYATQSVNKRLREYRVKTALAKNNDNFVYVLLVSEDKLKQFEQYCVSEGLDVILWLDEIEPSRCSSRATLRCDCGELDRVEAVRYLKPPPGETPFGFSSLEYDRAYFRCRSCNHLFSESGFDYSKIYSGAYVEATYGQELKNTFDRIVNLPTERSDNYARVKYLSDFLRNKFSAELSPLILDVGSGLGVFPYLMKKFGWSVEALDPDKGACEHISERVGIKVYQKDFFELNVRKRFDLITLNKVLEHVNDPVRMLSQSKNFLSKSGYIYVEVPDTEAAASISFEREEFFIEHLHVFSFASISIAMSKAGFRVLKVERLCEPSGKYTLRALAQIIDFES